VMLQTEGGDKINVIRDPGVREVFEQDGRFKKADIYPATQTDVTPQVKARIHKLFADHLGRTIEKDSAVIADAVSQAFPEKAAMLRHTLQQFYSLSLNAEAPKELLNLNAAFEDCLRRVRETNPTLMRVAQHIDTLREGLQTLNLWHGELTTEAVQNVRDAVIVRDKHLQQLHEVDGLPAEQNEHAAALDSHLQGHRPWQEISSLHDAIEGIRDAYTTERARLLAGQGTAIESAKAAIRSRTGFSTLSAEKSSRVLKLLEDAEDNTTPEAIAPSLAALKTSFQLRLETARHEANALLDRLLSEGDNPMIVPVDLHLDNRELASEADVDALLAEIRKRLLEQLKSGQRVRLI